MDIENSHRLNERLLEPYELPDDCPYLSEDQLELCRMTLPERIAWMGEWLRLAASLPLPEDEEDDAAPSAHSPNPIQALSKGHD